MNADTWADHLASARFDSAFNPYSDVCPCHDLDDAPGQRRRALVACLKRALEMEVDSIWIARDLGYRGGRRTGLALTDDVHLARHAGRWSVDVDRYTKGAPVAEVTASIIWRSLDQIEQPVFLWNVFPLHPHEATDPMSNRAHTAGERDFGLTMLESLVGMLRPKRVVAIGGDAFRASLRLGLDPANVRHPSYGGARIFTSQVASLYGLPHAPEQTLLL